MCSAVPVMAIRRSRPGDAEDDGPEIQTGDSQDLLYCPCELYFYAQVTFFALFVKYHNRIPPIYLEFEFQPGHRYQKMLLKIT